MRRWWIAGVVVAVVALVVWRCDRAPAHHAVYVESVDPRRPAHLALSVRVFRALYDDQQRRAKEVAARRYPLKDATASSGLDVDMITPACILGPADTCVALAEPIRACDGGDAGSCLAVGQMLSETAPRPMVAIEFFMEACKAGDSIACDRMKELKSAAPAGARCEDDVFACAWRAVRAHDLARLDEACTLGVADACAYLIMENANDPVAERAYLESACQLGAPNACSALGQRLSIGCSLDICYPPDPGEAATALAIACAGGWSGGC